MSRPSSRPTSGVSTTALAASSWRATRLPQGRGIDGLDRGEGTFVFDTEGRRYLDALSCLFCAQIGYSYGEEMGDAGAEQLTRLAFNTNWGTAHPAAIELARSWPPLRRMASRRCSSPVAAPSLSRRHGRSRGSSTSRTANRSARAQSPEDRYHGLSLGALSLTGIPALKEPFGSAAFETIHVSNTNSFRAPDADDPKAFGARLLAELEETIERVGPDTVAMIAAEPVQNAGGCFVPPTGYWTGLVELSDHYGILLLAARAITGFGRLGEWFGVTRYNGAPDLITVAKGLTSAYAPMGAVLVHDRVAEPLYADGALLAHGITFGGHPLARGYALRNLTIFERDGVLENVRLTLYLNGVSATSEPCRSVGDVRGDGFFWAVELVGPDQRRLDEGERDRLVRDFSTPDERAGNHRPSRRSRRCDRADCADSDIRSLHP